MKVPWMSKEKISAKASDLIADYELMVGYTVTPPIPVEEIIERYLDLKIGFVDFEKTLGLPAVLGATYVKKRLVCANENLLDSQSGRLSFTFAHEAGHWMLHRSYVDTTVQPDPDKEIIFCRAKNANLPIEWQADFFASCLLMPEKDVKNAWHREYGPDPLIIHNVSSAYAGPLCFDPCASNWHLIAATVRHSGNFSNVSKQAMIIRLQELGFVKNETGAYMGWGKVFFKN